MLKYLASPFTDPDRKRSSHGESLFALDGARGLSVLIVIASHADVLALRGQGSVGVFLFFVLSGFVLALPYIDSPSRILSAPEVMRFFVNRILRIMPVFVVAVLVIRWNLGETWSWALQNLSFRSAWLHLWSVAEEVRFYALFPLAMALLAFLPNAGARMIALIAMIVAAWGLSHHHRIDMMTEGFAPFYFWIFLVGVLSAMLYRWISIRTGRVFGAISLTVLPLLLLTSEPTFNGLWRPIFPKIPSGFSLNGWLQPEMWCVLLSIFLIGVTTAPASIAGRLMHSYPIRLMGLLSYSLYLFHLPILVALRGAGLHGWWLFSATLATSFVVAIFTYLVIEKPFLALKSFSIWPRRVSTPNP